MYARVRFSADKLLGAAALVPSVAACSLAHSDAAPEQREPQHFTAVDKIPLHTANASLSKLATSAPNGSPVHLVHAEVLFRHGQRTPVHVFPGVSTADGFLNGTSVVSNAPDARVINTKVSWFVMLVQSSASLIIRGFRPVEAEDQSHPPQ